MIQKVPFDLKAPRKPPSVAAVYVMETKSKCARGVQWKLEWRWLAMISNQNQIFTPSIDRETELCNVFSKMGRMTG
jgi:hypothetical protein